MPRNHMRLDDNSLTETGLASPKTADVSGRVLLLACGALAREILAMTRLNGWSHLDLACLPAKLHNVPQKIPEVIGNSLLKRQLSHWRALLRFRAIQ